MNLKQSARKAFRTTKVYELECLLREQTKWQRRETIAQNKLVYVRKQIVKLCEDLARATVGLAPKE